MKANNFLYLSGGLVFSASLCQAQNGNTAATNERPNVIYLLCDDMGYSDIEAYGQQMISTPNLTRLVNNGMSFTQFYASTAVSAPSRASLMTGQHTGHTKIRGNKEIQPEGQEPLDPTKSCRDSQKKIQEKQKPNDLAADPSRPWLPSNPWTKSGPHSFPNCHFLYFTLNSFRQKSVRLAQNECSSSLDPVLRWLFCWKIDWKHK